MKNQWKKIIAERALNVVDIKDVSRPAAELLTEDISPEAYIQVLIEAEKWMDATKVLVFALPRREAVWWACLCARGMEGVRTDEPQQKALAAAEKWVYEPTDDHRTAAYLTVQKCKGASGGSLCALAVAMSEEILPLGGEQTLEMDSAAFPKVVFGIIMKAATEANNGMMGKRLQDYLVTGEDIARGGSGKKEGLQPD